MSTMISAASVGFCATVDPGRRRALHLGLRRSLGSRDDRPRVAHLPARGRRHAGDVGDHWLRDLAGDVLRGPLLLRAAYLADQHDGAGFGVLLESLQAVDEVRARDRVAAYPDTGRLADTLLATAREEPGMSACPICSRSRRDRRQARCRQR